MRALCTIGLGAMLAFVINAAPVQAQSPIVYVSAGGNDANACTFAAPCRLLQRAVNVVPAGGVVQVLNSAGYGHVTITKSLTISGGGNVVALGHRIVVNSAGAVVVLRGLVMDGRGLGSGLNGISISAAAAVHIEDCEIARYSGDGIRVDSANTELFIAGSVIRDNGVNGLQVSNAGAKATIDNSRFENNGQHGLNIIGAESTITRTVITGNGLHGILQQGGSMNVTWTTAAHNYVGYLVQASGEMTLESSVAHGNYIGLEVAGGSTVRISNSVVTNNAYGIFNDGGTLLTRGNNTVSGNNTDLFGNALTPLGGV